MRVDQRREDVLKISSPSFGYIALDHINISMFEDNSLSDPPGAKSGLSISATKRKIVRGTEK